jgi:hypothetical protein
MSRKAMEKSEFNQVMKRCRDNYKVRYVSPVIHPRANIVTAFTIWTDNDVIQFSITNNPDESFDLNEAVNKFLDTL